MGFSIQYSVPTTNFHVINPFSPALRPALLSFMRTSREREFPGCNPSPAMRRPVPAARFLVPLCFVALSISPSGGVEPLPGVKKVEVIQSWTGQLPDEALQKLSPPIGFLTTQREWAALWRAWRGKEEPPAPNFARQLVLVFTVPGPNNLGCGPTIDSKGNVTAMAATTLIAGPGFGYLIQIIPRDGVRSVNGKALDAKHDPPPAESPPFPGIGIPGAMPGSEGGADGSGDAGLGPAMVEIPGVAANQGIFASATRSEPVVIRSQGEAAHHFGADERAKLVRLVDFSRQFILVFAWRGSGQDRMDAAVAESFPEKVFFRHLPGMTRDLRPHVRIFALRNGVTWRVD
jgi:hypothetical protein